MDVVGRIGEVFAGSADTIVLAMMTLSSIRLSVLQGSGPYFAIGVAPTAIVTAVSLSASSVIVGKAVFWPGEYDKAPQRVDSKAWARVTNIVDKKLKVVLAASLALLIVVLLGALDYKESFNFFTGFRVDIDSAAGQEVAVHDIGTGEIAPTMLLIGGQGLDPP